MPLPHIRPAPKRTDDALLAAPLRSHIATVYHESPDAYAEELATLTRLRQDARGAGCDAVGRDLLYRYYGQLELLELRFPIDEAHVKVLFNWYDSWTAKGVAQYSIAYEKACVVYNLAAVVAAIAVEQSRAASGPDSGGTGSAMYSSAANTPKSPGHEARSPASVAFHHFQAAAGIYTYINENFLHAPTLDLHKDSVRVLTMVMLAQAQECVLERSEGKSIGLQAKLAGWLAWEYGRIFDEVEAGVNRGVFSMDWSRLCGVKAKYYSAQAGRLRAEACLSTGKYGEAVARLKGAEAMAKESVRLAQIFSTYLSSAAADTMPADAGSCVVDMAKSLHAQLMEQANAVSRDNDLVYHDTVPAVDALPPFEKVCAVKAIPLTELYPSPVDVQRVIGPDVFSRLVPLAVHEQSSVYSEEKAQLVRTVAEKCDLADGELQAALAFMRLPESLDRFRADIIGSGGQHSAATLVEPSAEIRGIAGLIRSEEAHGSVEDLLQQLEGLRSEAKAGVDGVQAMLDMDATEWQSMKHRFEDAWAQSPTDSGTTAPQVRTHRASLEKAAESDKKLQTMFVEYQAVIAILAQGPGSTDLERVYSEAAATGSGDVVQENQAGPRRAAIGNVLDLTNELQDDEKSQLPDLISTVEDIIERLRRVKQERTDVLADLKRRTHEDDINHLILLHRRGQAPMPSDQQKALFTQELEKFRAHQQRVMQAVQRQAALLQDCGDAFRSLMESPEGRRIMRSWDKAERGINQLEACLKKASEAYRVIKDGVKTGFEFYVNIQDAIQELSNRTQAYVNRRGEDRVQNAKDLERRSQERGRSMLQEQLRLYEAPPPLSETPVVPMTGMLAQGVIPQQLYNSPHQQPPGMAPIGANQASEQLRLLEERVARLGLGGNPTGITPAQAGGYTGVASGQYGNNSHIPQQHQGAQHGQLYHPHNPSAMATMYGSQPGQPSPMSTLPPSYQGNYNPFGSTTATGSSVAAPYAGQAPGGYVGHAPAPVMPNPQPPYQGGMYPGGGGYQQPAYQQQPMGGYPGAQAIQPQTATASGLPVPLIPMQYGHPGVGASQQPLRPLPQPGGAPHHHQQHLYDYGSSGHSGQVGGISGQAAPQPPQQHQHQHQRYPSNGGLMD